MDGGDDLHPLRVEAELLGHQHPGLALAHDVGVAVVAGAAGQQALIVGLGHVGAGALAGLPFQLLVQLGLKVSDPLFVHLAVPLAGPVHLQDFAVQPVDFGGPGLVDLLFSIGLDESSAEGVLVAVEVIVGFLDLGVLEGKGLEPGAFDKLGHHHFCVPP